MADFEFEPEKALAVTAYLAEQSGQTMYTILKMVYVADRMHLERYGRPITGDAFIAMPQGACPSKIYDSMKSLRGDQNINFLPEGEKFLTVDATTHDVDVVQRPPMDVLSASDLECLEQTIAILKIRGGRHIRDLAHDSAWENTVKNTQMGTLEIAKTTQDGDALVSHLKTKFAA